MRLIDILAFGTLAMGMGHQAAPAHSAHVHGSAQLAIAVDAGGQLEAELEAPGDSVFGFEGAPRTEDQRHIMAQAMARLLDGAALIRFNDEAGCQFRGASSGEDGHHDTADHPHEAHGHSDAHIVYQFQCAHPDRLTRIETGLFTAFGRLEEIESVFLSPWGQEGFELTPASPEHRIAR